MHSFCLSAWKSPKNLQNDPPPGEENRPKTGPRRAKRAPRRSQEPSIQFSNSPFAAQSVLHRPTWRPRRPRRSPEAHLELPGGRNLTPGGRNLIPGASFFGPPGVDFSSPLRAPFPRSLGHTVPTMFSTPGPAECAKRLNNCGALPLQKQLRRLSLSKRIAAPPAPLQK